jgi:hypothetical protein
MTDFAFQTSKGVIGYDMRLVPGTIPGRWGPVIKIDDENNVLVCELSAANSSDMASFRSSLANALKIASENPPPGSGIPAVTVPGNFADTWAANKMTSILAACLVAFNDGPDTAVALNFMGTDALGPTLTSMTITAGETQLWSQRVVAYDGDDQIIADIRDYTDVANLWTNSHTLPTANLWRADENLVTELSAEATRTAVHGGAIDEAAPNPIAFERHADIFNLGSYDIAPTATAGIANVHLESPTDLGSGFDLSGSFYAGGAAFGALATFTVPTNILDTVFEFLGLLFPVVLDFDGNGIQIQPRTDSYVFFNTDGDSALERTAWVGPGDGMLVVDLNGDGKITRNELAFADRTADPNDTDLQALATLYDSNGDHQLDGADAAWSQLRVWKDVNGNGVADAGELKTLGELGISQIGLTSDHNTFTLSDNSRINGFGSFVINGASHTLADAALAYQTNGFTRSTQNEVTTYTLDDGSHKDHYDVHNLSGYNESPGLWLDLPGDYALDGVLGGFHDDIVHLAHASRSLTVYGDDGNDEIWTGSGNDVIDGGAGADKLLAGAGDDTIYFDASDLQVDGGPGYTPAF